MPTTINLRPLRDASSRELLEEMDVCTVVRGALEKLSHLVDEHEQPAARLRGALGETDQTVEDILIAPFPGAASPDEPRIHESLTHHLRRPLPPANDRQDAPALLPRRQRSAEDPGRFLAEPVRGDLPDSGLPAQRRGERDGQARLARAVRPCPRERPLTGLGGMPRHRLQHASRRSRANKPFQRGRVGKVRVDPDGLPEPPRDADAIGEGGHAAPLA